MPRRCILGCPSDSSKHFHVFPNVNKYPEKFAKWVEIVRKLKNTPEHYSYYLTKRLCDRHFTMEDHNRYNRLSAIAVPTLYLNARDAAASPDDDDVHEDEQDDEHEDEQDDDLNTESDPTEPVTPQFSWQETSLIALDDEPSTESENSADDGVLQEPVTKIRASGTDYTCDACQKRITGFRYTCVQCVDYDLCGRCEGKLIHPDHYALRVPTSRRRMREVKLIVEAIRRKLETLNVELEYDCIDRADCDVEIKKEEDPFDEETPETVPYHIEDTKFKVNSGSCKVPDVSRKLGTCKVENGKNTGHPWEPPIKNSNYPQLAPNGEDQNDDDDFEEEDYLDESLLEYIDSGYDTGMKDTLQEQVYDLKLEENMISEDSDAKKKRTITLKSPLKRTYVAVSKGSSGLQFIEKLKDSSLLNTISSIKSDATFNLPVVLNVKKIKQSESSINQRDIKMRRGQVVTSNTLLSGSNKNILEHQVKRKTKNIDDDIFDSVRKSPGLLTRVASKTMRIGNTKLSDNKKYMIHPGKRKPTEDISDEVRQSPGLSKVIAVSKIMKKPMKVRTDNIVAGKRLKLSGFDTGQVKEIVVDSGDRQSAL